jgi:hypothetical protein
MSDVSHLIEGAVHEMRAYQAGLRRDAEHGLWLGGLRHALVPTHVLARDLPNEVESLLGRPVAAVVMARIGQLIGRAQAEAFFADRGLETAEWRYRMVRGPMYFAWAGFGDVDLLLWDAVTDQDFTILWESDNSFSAGEALNDGHRSRCCHMQAGYAAGWNSAATGLQLEAREIACRAEGVSHCRFILGPAEGFEDRLLDPRFHRPTREYDVMRIDGSGIVEAITPPLGTVA